MHKIRMKTLRLKNVSNVLDVERVHENTKFQMQIWQESKASPAFKKFEQEYCDFHKLTTTRIEL